MHKLVGACIVLALVVAWAAVADDPGGCPLGHGAGIPVPERDELGHCECEKWWRGSPARLAFRDCSFKNCQENGPRDDCPNDGGGCQVDPWVYVDIQLYRCPRCGMLFTEPEPR